MTEFDVQPSRGEITAGDADPRLLRLRRIAEEMVASLWDRSREIRNDRSLTSKQRESRLAEVACTPENLAARVRRSPQAVRKWLQRHGTTPTELINSARMEHAARLLSCDERLHVKEVAARVGFADEATFRSHFKARWSVSPSEFWRRHEQSHGQSHVRENS